MEETHNGQYEPPTGLNPNHGAPERIQSSYNRLACIWKNILDINKNNSVDPFFIANNPTPNFTPIFQQFNRVSQEKVLQAMMYEIKLRVWAHSQALQTQLGPVIAINIPVIATFQNLGNVVTGIRACNNRFHNHTFHVLKLIRILNLLTRRYLVTIQNGNFGNIDELGQVGPPAPGTQAEIAAVQQHVLANNAILPIADAYRVNCYQVHTDIVTAETDFNSARTDSQNGAPTANMSLNTAKLSAATARTALQTISTDNSLFNSVDAAWALNIAPIFPEVDDLMAYYMTGNRVIAARINQRLLVDQARINAAAAGPPPPPGPPRGHYGGPYGPPRGPPGI